jgi:hypothetical protein
MSPTVSTQPVMPGAMARFCQVLCVNGVSSSNRKTVFEADRQLVQDMGIGMVHFWVIETEHIIDYKKSVSHREYAHFPASTYPRLVFKVKP